MSDLREKLFLLLAKRLTKEEFETWLYADAFILSNVEKEPILELLCINLKSTQALYELQLYCNRQFGEDNFLVRNIEYQCENFLEQPSEQNAMLLFYGTVNSSDEKGRHLLYQFYLMELDFETSSYYENGAGLSGLKRQVAVVLEKLQERNEEEKIQLLYQGINDFRFRNMPQNAINQRSKKWYQFWR